MTKPTQKTAEQRNGYKDPSQSILDYVLVELDGDITGACNPARGAKRLVREWQSVYSSAKIAAIAGTGIGLVGFGGLLAMSVPLTAPLTIFSGIGGLLSAAFVKHHAEGAKTAQAEHDFLQIHPEILRSLAYAVGQGLSQDTALAVYQECLKKFSIRGDRALDPATIRQIYAETVNGALAGYQMGAEGATAFATGQRLPDPAQDRRDALAAQADEAEFDDDEFEDDEAADTYSFTVPAFLADPAPSPKPDGAAFQASPIAAPTQTAILPRVQAPLLTRIAKVGGFLPSRLFIGASRTGKSQVASDALSQVRTEYPDASIYYISAGFKEAEDGWYWAAANHVGGYALKDMKPEAVRGAYEHWASLIEAFRDNANYSAEKPKVLVVDELDSIMAFANGAGNSGKHVVTLLINTLTAASSTGAKDGFIMWAIAPVGDCAGLGLTRGKVSAMNPVFVAFNGTEWNEATYKTAAANGLAPATRPQGFREGDRVIGIGGNWELLPPSPKLAQSINDCRFYPPSGMDLVMDAVAVQTMAQTFEKPGRINPDGTQEPIAPLGDDDAQAEIIRFLGSVEDPKRVKDIRNCARPPVRGMASQDIRNLLDELVEANSIQTDGTRFFLK